MEMRRKDRNVTDINEIKLVFEESNVARVGFVDSHGLYIVPLNYGYELNDDNKFTLYMHSAKEGRKISAIKNAVDGKLDVTVLLDCGHALVPGEIACDYGYLFKSVMGQGKATLVDDLEEKKKGLNLLMKHYTEKEFGFNEQMVASVEVIKIVLDDFSCKIKKPAAKNAEDTTPKAAYAFVDGSYNVNTKVYGYGGFVVVGEEKHIVQGSGTDEEMASMRNVAGEVLGSMAAIKKAISLGVTKLDIYYDYMGIEMWATGQWKRNKKGTIAYYDYIMSVKDKIELNFIKVKGHSNVPGNEEADKLAKQAAGVS